MKSSGATANKVVAADPYQLGIGQIQAREHDRHIASAASSSARDVLGSAQHGSSEENGRNMHGAESKLVGNMHSADVAAGNTFGLALNDGRDNVGVSPNRQSAQDADLLRACSCAPCRQDVWVYYPELCKIFGDADAPAVMSSAIKIADKTHPDVELDRMTAVALLSIATALSGPADPRTTVSDHICQILRLPYHVEEAWRQKVRRIGGRVSESVVAAAEWKLLQLISDT